MAKIRIYAVENGPYVVELDGKTHAALCRCGSSSNKPHCDGSHRRVEFKAVASQILEI